MTVPLGRMLQISFGVALLAIVVWFIATFPIFRVFIAIGFTAYAILLWRWPSLWLVVMALRRWLAFITLRRPLVVIALRICVTGRRGPT